MRRTILAAILTLLAGGAHAADPLALQLRGTPRAEFAGYYVAQDKGFYAEEGLEVTILPGGPGIAPTEALATGAADVAVDWLPSALLARERGLPVVNIAQPFHASALMLACLRESGIRRPEDLRGRMLGAWTGGGEYPLLAWLNGLGLGVNGAPDGVTLRDQGAGVDALLRKQAACIMAMSHDEYLQLRAAGLEDDDLVIFRPGDADSVPEDGLYTLDQTLADPRMADSLTRFVRASLRGWRQVEAQPGEAAEIVARSAGEDAADTLKAVQDVVRLTSGSTGALDITAAARTAEALRRGPAPLLTAPPAGAWTSAITDRAIR